MRHKRWKTQYGDGEMTPRCAACGSDEHWARTIIHIYLSLASRPRRDEQHEQTQSLCTETQPNTTKDPKTGHLQANQGRQQGDKDNGGTDDGS